MPDSDSHSSSVSSIKDVTAVMVLNWSMEMEEGHLLELEPNLEANTEAAKSGMESEVGKKEEYWDPAEIIEEVSPSWPMRNRVICSVSSYVDLATAVLLCNKKITTSKQNNTKKLSQQTRRIRCHSILSSRLLHLSINSFSIVYQHCIACISCSNQINAKL